MGQIEKRPDRQGLVFSKKLLFFPSKLLHEAAQHAICVKDWAAQFMGAVFFVGVVSGRRALWVRYTRARYTCEWV